MESNELRIGNYVANKNGFVMQVVGIYRDNILLDFEGNEGDVWESDIKDLQAIPITKEWLMKLGFSEVECNNNEYEKMVSENEICTLWINKRNNAVENHIFRLYKFVHEVQNMYYLFYNKELIYAKLSPDKN